MIFGVFFFFHHFRGAAESVTHSIFALSRIAIGKQLSSFQEELSTTSSLASNLRKAYTNEWAVRIAGGSEAEATRLAAKYGYLNLGRVSFLPFIASELTAGSRRLRAGAGNGDRRGVRRANVCSPPNSIATSNPISAQASPDPHMYLCAFIQRRTQICSVA